MSAISETPYGHDSNQPALAVVRRWFSNGPQDVMELNGGDRVRLLPWVPSVVKKVDLEAKRVEVDWRADW